MLGTNRWAMLVTVSLMIAATAALPAAGAQSGLRDPVDASPCQGDLNVTCYEGNGFCPAYSELAGCPVDKTITPCHSSLEIGCEQEGGDVCVLWLDDQVYTVGFTGCLI